MAKKKSPSKIKPAAKKKSSSKKKLPASQLPLKKRPTTNKKPSTKKKLPNKQLAATQPAGPVTLAEARAMVQTQMPKRALRRSVDPVPTSPEAVGAERERLEQKQREEFERRIREYRATLSIMKQRGVKGLAGQVVAGVPKRRAAAAGAQPLQILAEGDSWFDYPVPFFGGGVIPRLENRLGVPILNLAKAGDEVRFMMGVKERTLLIQHLQDGCPAGGPWDVMLFSGGGNDIVGEPMALWIQDYDPARQAAEQIHGPRFDAAMSLVAAGYEDLIGLRDVLSPNTQLVFHAYDFAIPDGRGVCYLGPWLKPTFSLRKFPSQDAAFEVVKVMLQKFAAFLQDLQDRHTGVTFINGQGTLLPIKSSWHNELHPSKAGFNQFADLFHQKLKSQFPSRVL